VKPRSSRSHSAANLRAQSREVLGHAWYIPLGWQSYLWWIPPGWLLPLHMLALCILILFACGAWTRATSIASFIIVVSYANRAVTAEFGFDDILAILLLYLAIGPSGATLSIDALRRRRPPPAPSIAANIAVRLLSIHMSGAQTSPRTRRIAMTIPIKDSPAIAPVATELA